MPDLRSGDPIGVIYVAVRESDGLVKVGFTARAVVRRLKDLKASRGGIHRLVALWPDSVRAQESHIHRSLRLAFGKLGGRLGECYRAEAIDVVGAIAEHLASHHVSVSSAAHTSNVNRK